MHILLGVVVRRTWPGKEGVLLFSVVGWAAMQAHASLRLYTQTGTNENVDCLSKGAIVSKWTKQLPG